MKTPLMFPALLLGLSADGQTDSAFSFSGYAELYYSYEAARPEDHVRQGPFYCFNRHNEVNLDLGLVKLAYAKNNVRGKEAEISAEGSKVKIYMIPTNEEIVIARDTKAICAPLVPAK